VRGLGNNVQSYINIYIENYISKLGGDIVEYTIDFDTVESALNFFQFYFPQAEYSANKFYNLRTPNQGRHRMFAGSWYSIPMSMFENSEYENINEGSEGGGGYSGIIELKNSITDYSQYLTNLKNEEYEFLQDSNISFQAELEVEFINTPTDLVVVNCGQGNWNEIHSKSEVLIYDMGASSRYSSTQIKNLVTKRFSKFKEKSIGIVISHWDMDHFQALNYLDKKQLSQILFILGPSNIPPSNVYKSTIKHLKNNNVYCRLIPPTTNRNGRAINLNKISTSKTVDVYRSVSGSSRNQTGIVLVIKGTKRIALLTGDHHYEKIFDAINTKYTGRDTVLVVPHHGGNSGSLRLSDWQSEFPVIECPISYGDNSYNHPNQNLSRINSLQGGSPKTTYTQGDLNFNI
jgi:beta-lactamase superfamily II metal-dependent hydrolase